jgi:hypothetical protein
MPSLSGRRRARARSMECLGLFFPKLTCGVESALLGSALQMRCCAPQVYSQREVQSSIGHAWLDPSDTKQISSYKMRVRISYACWRSTDISSGGINFHLI